MSKATEIVDDMAAFIRSTATTAVAVAVGVTGFIAVVLALDIVPEEYKTKFVAVGAFAALVTTAGRQIIAWLDPKNLSFGRVTVEVDPGVDEPGDSQTPDGVFNDAEIAAADDGGEFAKANEPDLTDVEAGH